MLKLSFIVCISALIASFAGAQRVDQVDACSTFPCRDDEICIPISRSSFKCVGDIVPLVPETRVPQPRVVTQPRVAAQPRVLQQNVVSTSRIAAPISSPVLNPQVQIMTKPLASIQEVDPAVADITPVSTPVLLAPVVSAPLPDRVPEPRGQVVSQRVAQQQTIPRNSVPRVQETVATPKLTALVPNGRTPVQSRKMELMNYCMGQQSGDQVPHPFDKRRFIFCKKAGDYIEMNCPGNLVYNTFLSRCDHTDKEPVSSCASNPCLNGGECIELDNMRFRCECREGFSGENCGRGVDACFSNPCGVNGVCNVLPLKNVPYYCTCDGETRYGMDCATQAVRNPCMEDRTSTETYIESEISKQLFIHCEAETMFLKFCNEPLVWDQSTSSCVWSNDQVVSRFRF